MSAIAVSASPRRACWYPRKLYANPYVGSSAMTSSINSSAYSGSVPLPLRKLASVSRASFVVRELVDHRTHAIPGDGEVADDHGLQPLHEEPVADGGLRCVAAGPLQTLHRGHDLAAARQEPGQVEMRRRERAVERDSGLVVSSCLRQQERLFGIQTSLVLGVRLDLIGRELGDRRQLGRLGREDTPQKVCRHLIYDVEHVPPLSARRGRDLAAAGNRERHAELKLVASVRDAAGQHELGPRQLRSSDLGLRRDRGPVGDVELPEQIPHPLGAHQL